MSVEAAYVVVAAAAPVSVFGVWFYLRRLVDRREAIVEFNTFTRTDRRDFLQDKANRRDEERRLVDPRLSDLGEEDRRKLDRRGSDSSIAM